MVGLRRPLGRNGTSLNHRFRGGVARMGKIPKPPGTSAPAGEGVPRVGGGACASAWARSPNPTVAPLRHRQFTRTGAGTRAGYADRNAVPDCIPGLLWPGPAARSWAGAAGSLRVPSGLGSGSALPALIFRSGRGGRGRGLPVSTLGRFHYWPEPWFRSERCPFPASVGPCDARRPHPGMDTRVGVNGLVRRPSTTNFLTCQ